MFQDLPVWLAHFRGQAAHPRRVPATLEDRLTGRERRLIADSIATFQLGESSDGRHLRQAARRHCQEPQLEPLVEIVDLLIAEEQRHAQLLGEFMHDHEIALRDQALTDRAFRLLRRCGGLAARLRILFTAEIIGIVYYRALEVVTDCRRLQILCRSLAADELAHVAFESQLLRAMKGTRGAVAGVLAEAWGRCLLVAASLLVWATHRRVLAAAGYGPVLFVRDCRRQHDFYLGWPPAARRAHPRRDHPLSPHGT
jgi:hypothetical protein